MYNKTTNETTNEMLGLNNFAHVLIEDFKERKASCLDINSIQKLKSCINSYSYTAGEFSLKYIGDKDGGDYFNSEVDCLNVYKVFYPIQPEKHHSKYFTTHSYETTKYASLLDPLKEGEIQNFDDKSGVVSYGEKREFSEAVLYLCFDELVEDCIKFYDNLPDLTNHLKQKMLENCRREITSNADLDSSFEMVFTREMNECNSSHQSYLVSSLVDNAKPIWSKERYIEGLVNEFIKSADKEFEHTNDGLQLDTDTKYKMIGRMVNGLRIDDKVFCYHQSIEKCYETLLHAICMYHYNDWKQEFKSSRT